MKKMMRIYFDIVELSKENKLCIPRLMCAFINCHLIHGASWDNFKVLEMFKYNNTERRKVYTFKRQKCISDALNRGATVEEKHILMDKIMKHVGYIGWDIAVLPDGCEIIEANVDYPGTNIIQLNGFDVYGKVKAFLKEHSVILNN